MTVPGGSELLIILAIFVLLFGAKKLPELSRSVGQSITSFKQGIHEAGDDERQGGADAEADSDGEPGGARERADQDDELGTEPRNHGSP